MSRPTRSYAGLSAEQRVGLRRTALLAAGRELLAEVGWKGTSLRAVCARAGVADRYFYESFENRDVFLTALWDQVMADVLVVTAEQVAQVESDFRSRVRACTGAVLLLMESEAGLVRVMLTETPDTAALHAQQRRMMGQLVDLLTDLTADSPELGEVDPGVRRLGAHAILGALFELLTAYLAGEIDCTREELLAFAAQLAVRVSGLPAHSPPPDLPRGVTDG